MKTIPPLVCLDRKRFQSASETYDNTDNKKRKRKEKDDKDDNEIKKPKKEKKNSEAKSEAKVEGPSKIINRLEAIVDYQKKIEAIESLKDEDIKKCCNTKHNGSKIFVAWLTEETEYIENDMNDFRGITLIKQLVSILNPTVEKDHLKIKWTPELVKSTRIDKIIRRIYKSFQAKITNDNNDDDDEKEVLTDMIEVLKTIWTKFREIFNSGNSED